MGNFTLNGTALTSATATLTTSDQINWTLANLSNLTYTSATYTLALVPGPGITDWPATPWRPRHPVTWTMSSTVPAVVSVVPSGSSPTKATTLQFTVTFKLQRQRGGEFVQDFIVQTTGTAAGTYAGVSGSGAVYTVTVTGVSGDGTLGLYVYDNDDIKAGTIPLGGTGKANNAGSGSFAGQTTYTIDNTAPTVSISRPSVPYAAGGPVTYVVIYADANFNSSTLAAANITLNTTGTANGTLSVSGSGLTRTVTISGITGDGSLGISIAAGTASDLAGNLAPAAGPSATFTVDNTAPTISIGGPSASYTAGGSVTYAVTYADANFNSSTLAAANITLNATGTANGTLASPVRA